MKLYEWYPIDANLTFAPATNKDVYDLLRPTFFLKVKSVLVLGLQVGSDASFPWMDTLVIFSQRDAEGSTILDDDAVLEINLIATGAHLGFDASWLPEAFFMILVMGWKVIL